MRKKLKSLTKVLAFFLIFTVLLSVTSRYIQPIWLRWNNYFTTAGFYEEKENTIETVILGPSTLLSDIIPPELYEDYGICAYNLCTEQQPVLASYYWTQEVYKYHSETLKTVIFSVSELRDASGKTIYHKALDNMKPSWNKIKAFTAYNNGNIFQVVLDMIPLYAYHDRWSEITMDDFDYLSLDPDNGTRGYNFDPFVWGIDNRRATIKNVTLDDMAEPEELIEGSVFYFEKLVEFCEEKGLKLVLAKAPATNWDSALHNASQELADKYGLEFYDFNFGELYDEVNIIDEFDSIDGGRHLNYYGATKLTDWFGRYLSEECGATDVRGMEEYAFLDEQLEKFDSLYRETIRLQQTTDVTECLSSAIEDDTTVFITIRETAAKNLTKEQRQTLYDLGLKKLSEIKDGDCYCAVVSGGKVVLEEYRRKTYTTSRSALTFTKTLDDGTEYTLTSGGSAHGKTASIIIDGTEYAENTRGINICTYNNTHKKVTYSTCFDTHEASSRDVYLLEFAEGAKDEEFIEQYKDNEVFKLVLNRYNSIENFKGTREETLLIKNMRLKEYLNKFIINDTTTAVIIASGDATSALTSENRTALSKIGLTELSLLDKNEPYIAIIGKDGAVKYEKAGEADSAITYSKSIYRIVSAAGSSEEACSISVDGQEFKTDKNGLYVVIYDSSTENVLSNGVFDTSEKPLNIN